MPIHDIIEDLYNSDELNSCIAKMVRLDLRQDFKQELFVILCEFDKQKLKEIFDGGKLKFYVVRIIINMVSQQRNVFHKKYLNPNLEYLENVYEDTQITDPDEMTQREENEAEEVEMLKRISEMDSHFNTFFYRALTELHKRHGSMSKAGRETGIPVSTISRGFKKIREHLNSLPNA